MNVEIVSSSTRRVLKLTSVVFIYIPLTESEIKELKVEDISYPCFRISKEIT